MVVFPCYAPKAPPLPLLRKDLSETWLRVQYAYSEEPLFLISYNVTNIGPDQVSSESRVKLNPGSDETHERYIAGADKGILAEKPIRLSSNTVLRSYLFTRLPPT